MIDLDFSNTKSVEDVQYKPIEDGEYLFLIQDATIEASKDPAKKPSMKIVLSSVEDSKKTIWQYFYLDGSNEVSMAYLKDFLEKAFDTELSGNLTIDTILPELRGKHIIATVTVQPRKDDKTKMQNNVEFYTTAP